MTTEGEKEYSPELSRTFSRNLSRKVSNGMCELRSLTKMFNSLCLADSYTIVQWLEHCLLQVRVLGSCLQTFPVCVFPSHQLIFFDLGLPACCWYVKCVGYSEGCVPPGCVDSQEV